jgi:tetratricopeptide (TPR) repeat protein
MKNKHTTMVVIAMYVMIMQSCSIERRLLKDCSEDLNTEMKISCYTKAIKKSPKNASLYFKRGKAYQDILKFTCSMQDYMKVVELEPGNTDIYYALASVASLAYYREKALYWLKKALEAGYNNYEQLVKDPSFYNLKNTREFIQLLDMYYPDALNSKK